MLKNTATLFFWLVYGLTGLSSKGTALTSDDQKVGSNKLLKLRPLFLKCSAPDLVKETYRIHLCSVSKKDGKSKIHEQLEAIRKKASFIGAYTAIISSEKGYEYYYGQIGPFSTQEEATPVQTNLKKVLDILPQISPPGTVYQQGIELEKAELHLWE